MIPQLVFSGQLALSAATRRETPEEAARPHPAATRLSIAFQLLGDGHEIKVEQLFVRMHLVEPTIIQRVEDLHELCVRVCLTLEA